MSARFNRFKNGLIDLCMDCGVLVSRFDVRDMGDTTNIDYIRHDIELKVVDKTSKEDFITKHPDFSLAFKQAAEKAEQERRLKEKVHASAAIINEELKKRDRYEELQITITIRLLERYLQKLRKKGFLDLLFMRDNSSEIESVEHAISQLKERVALLNDPAKRQAVCEAVKSKIFGTVEDSK